MAMPVPRPVVAFDVFGTLVDPAGIAESLRPLAGGDAERLAAEWRRVQVEYVFRRAAMGAWRPFAEVTAAALAATAGLHSIWIGAGRPAEHWEWSPTATVASLADVPAAIATE